MSRSFFQSMTGIGRQRISRLLSRRGVAALALSAMLAVGQISFPHLAQAKWMSEAVPTLRSPVNRPALDPVAQLPDLREVKAGPKRKTAFLELLVPLVEAENARIQSDRNWLVGIKTRINPLREDEKQRLAQLCDDYGVTCEPGKVSHELLARVNTVPLEMVIIQAVEESGWGTSRIARESNNLFGMRCFSAGCGMAQQGTSRRFQVFDSVRDGVRAYLHNLNTHGAYAQLRHQRAALAAKGKKISAETLIGTLHNYSTSPGYQQQLLSLLRTNGELIRRHGSDGQALAGSPA